jgi:hypothetical protein
MTKEFSAALADLISAASKFMPTDKSIKSLDALGNTKGNPTVYGRTINGVDYTDHDLVRLRNAVDLVKKLKGRTH